MAKKLTVEEWAKGISSLVVVGFIGWLILSKDETEAASPVPPPTAEEIAAKKA